MKSDLFLFIRLMKISFQTIFILEFTNNKHENNNNLRHCLVNNKESNLIRSLQEIVCI